MACDGCGSDWLSTKGKDCVACPWCCKLKRCQERKRGRWDRPKGEPFRPSMFKKKRRRTKRQSNHCHHCGQRLKPTQIKYCHRSCFYAARKAGTQKWDRTKQTEGCYHRGGRWSNAISKKYVKRVASLDRWLSKASSLWARMWRLHQLQRCCQVCGTACNEGASRFCSYKCAKDWRGSRPCVVCSVAMPDCKSQGKVFCSKCKAEAKRRYRRQYKRELGSHRKKVRKGGGFWNSKVRRSVVLSRDRHRCYLCNAKCKVGWKYNDPKCATVDMVVPACKGGDWDYHNLRCACRACNSRKSGTLTGQLTFHMRT
jgi:hypothetical protein